MPQTENNFAGMQDSVMRAALSMQRYSWEQGVLSQAPLELGEDDWVIAMAVEALNRQMEDGRASVIGYLKSSTDPCSTGEALLFAYRRTGEQAFLDGVNRLLEWAMKTAPRSPGGIVYHVEDSCEFWADSLFMLPPFLAATGEYDEALRQIEGYWQALYRPQAGLLAHQWDDGAGKFRRGAFWGGGNGWAAAGLARVIAMLPKDGYAPQKQLLASRVQALLDACLGHLRPDGLFYDILDDPESFVETNCSQMLAYAIYCGVAGGWLTLDYLPHAEVMYHAIMGKIDAYGFVQGVCGSPYFGAPGISPEGQAFHLLMQGARRRCAAK